MLPLRSHEFYCFRKHRSSNCSRGLCVIRATREGSGLPPARSGIQRKDLQKTAELEYLRTFYEAAAAVDGDDVLVRLDGAEAAAAARARAERRAAELNKRLAARIRAAESWDDLVQILQQHAGDLNYLNVSLLAARAGGLAPGAAAPPADAARLAHWLPPAAAASAAPPSSTPPELDAIGALVLERAPSFHAAHFAAAAWGLASAGLRSRGFWRGFCAAAARKVPALSFAQLGAVLCAVASSEYVPPLGWVERAQRQAKKHLAAAEPLPLSQLLWAWGEWGYSPRDKPLVNEIKGALRRMLARRDLTADQMVMVMHGVARLDPEYWPNPRWMAVFVARTWPHLAAMAPGDVIGLLLALTAMGHRPHATWMAAALARLRQGLGGGSERGSGGGERGGGGLGGGGLGSGGLGGAAQAEQQGGCRLPQAALPGSVDAGWAGEVRIGSSSGGGGGAGNNRGAPLSAGRASRLRSAGSAEQGGEEDGWLEEGEWEEDEEAGDAEQEEAEEEGEEEEDEAGAAAAADAWQESAGAAWDGGAATEGQAEQQQGPQQQQAPPPPPPRLTARQLAVTAWCLGALEYVPPPAWLQAYYQSITSSLQANELGPEELTDVIHGLAGVDAAVGPALSRLLLARVAEAMPGMGSEALARTCAGLSRLGVRPAAGAAAAALPAAAGAAGRRPAADEGEGAGAAGAAAWAAALDAAIVRTAPRMTTQHAADVLGFAAWAHLAPSPGAASAAADAAAAGAARAHPAALAGAVWSLAALSFKPPPALLHVMLSALQPRLGVLGRSDLAGLAWALCVLRHRPGARWLDLYMGEALAAAPRMSGQQLADVLWALACFGARPAREWLRRMADAAEARLAGPLPVASAGGGGGGVGSGGGARGPDEAEGMSSENAAVVVWALRELGYRAAGEAAAGRSGLLDALEAALVGAGAGGAPPRVAGRLPAGI